MDAEQMTDVVLNLLINAIEAVEVDTGTVTVSTELDAAANRVVLCVRDNGGGIENPDTIFEPFYTTKSKLGAGLGLAIARKIVENHAGTIEVQSAPGEETAFTVRIPC